MHAPSSRINSTISAVFAKQRQPSQGPRGRGGSNSKVGKNAASEKSGAISGKQVASMSISKYLACCRHAPLPYSSSVSHHQDTFSHQCPPCCLFLRFHKELVEAPQLTRLLSQVLGTKSTGQAPAAAEGQQKAGGGAVVRSKIAQQAHLPNAPSRFGYPTLTKGHYLQNITVMHEKISAPKGSGGRWDSGGGQALDKALKDDGPKQLQTAIMVLVTVAGSFICGGAAIVACCWRGREKGWSSAAKQEHREKFKGSGAQWLEMDC